jgi:hypothetical protein
MKGIAGTKRAGRTTISFQIEGTACFSWWGSRSASKREGPLPPRRWVERGFNIEHWTEISRGGHFPALEEPELLVEDIRWFVGALR